MRRLTLLLAAGALWLFLAAVPAFADGGPHVAATNTGVSGADGRQLRRLPPGPHRPGRCTCSSTSDGSTTLPDVPRRDRPGATTDVENGVQYAARAPTRIRGGTAARRPPRRRLRHRPGSAPATPSARRVPERHQHVRQNAKVPVRDRAARRHVTSAHLPNMAGVGRSGSTASPGATAPTAPPVRRARRRRSSARVPQPARERPVPHPQPDPGSARRRAPTCSSPAAVAAHRHRRGAAAGRRHPQLHRHPDQRRHRHAPREPGGAASACRQRRATTSAEGSVERREPARRTTRRTAVRDLHHADHDLVPHVPHALPQRGLGRQTPATRSSSTATPPTNTSGCTHVPRGARLQRPDDGSTRGDIAYPGGTAATSADELSRLLKVDNRGTCQALPRSDGDDHRHDAGRPHADPYSGP